MDDLRPRDWSEYIGQTQLKDRLLTYCEDTLARVAPLDHVLLYGEPGFGKTSLAAIIAAELGEPFEVLTMPIRPAALMKFFNNFRGGVVLFDEFHRLSHGQQEDFFNPLEDKYFTTPNGRKVTIPWFTAIIATTEKKDIIAPVLRRIPIRGLSFDPYTDDEIGLIVAQMARKLGFTLDETIAAGLGHAAGGRPGEAHGLVVAARALSHRGPISVESVLAFCEVDADGVTKEHRTLMRAIDKLAGTGAVGMLRLSDYVGMDQAIIRSLQRLLIDLDLIDQGGAGVELTSAGVRRIRDSRAA